MRTVQAVQIWTGRQRLIFMAALLCILNLFIAGFWSNRPFWIDADHYAARLQLGVWVAHPPGSFLFMVLAHAILRIVSDPYLSLQLISHFSYMASIPLLYFVFLKILPDKESAILTVAYAFSWVPLLLCNVGTSHATDLVFGAAILAVATTQGFQQSKPWSLLSFFLILTLIAGFRMSSLVLWLPAVFFLLRRHSSVRLLPGIALLLIGGLLIGWMTVHFSGGWNAYMDRVHAISKENSYTNVFQNGINKQTAVNIFRSLLWFALQFSFLLYLFPSFFKKTAPSDIALPKEALLCMAIIPVCVMALYYGSHPGYLAACTPAIFTLFAISWKERKQPETFRTGYRLLALYIVFSMSIFLGFHYIRHPSDQKEAALNAFLLQYSRDGIKNAAVKPLSDWLSVAGREDLVPASRMEMLRYRRPKKEKTSTDSPR